LHNIFGSCQASEIEEALEYALTRPENIMQAIESFVSETHPYTDGKSSKRVINACIDFIANGIVKRKPLNLVRRYQVRKKLNYMRFW